jgi:hypothetical protein
MSAFKKVVGLAAGVSTVAVIGVAVAQGVPPNPYITNPALGAGEQTVHMTPIGETGVLAWAPEVQQTAMLTREDQKAAVASETQPQQPEPVAQAPAPADTTVAQAAPAPTDTNTLGAGPATDNNDTAPVRAPKHDRG